MLIFASDEVAFDSWKIDGRKLKPRTVGSDPLSSGESSAGWTAANGGGAWRLVFTRPGYLYGWQPIVLADGTRFARKASGRPKRLTGSQLRWIYNTVTSKNPLQLQFPFALWTRAMIGTLIRRQYGIKLSAISVGRLLAQMGLSCQKPLSRAFEQDATLVKQWIERDFPKIRALAKKERAVVFFADESGVRSDFHAGTTWGIRGKTPVVRHTGKRFHLNMLSAISAKGELRFMTSRKRLSAALFIEFLRRLITNYPKKIFLVVDGLPAHKAKSVHRFVHQVKDRLRLFFLPPYSPEIIRVAATPLDREALPMVLARQSGWITKAYPLEYIDPQGVRRATWPSRFPLKWIEDKREEFQSLGLQAEFSRNICACLRIRPPKCSFHR